MFEKLIVYALRHQKLEMVFKKIFKGMKSVKPPSKK